MEKMVMRTPFLVDKKDLSVPISEGMKIVFLIVDEDFALIDILKQYLSNGVINDDWQVFRW